MLAKNDPLYVHATKTEPPQSPHLIPDGFKNVSQNPTQNPAKNPAKKLGLASYSYRDLIAAKKTLAKFGTIGFVR